MTASGTQPRILTREEAREILERKLAAPAPLFATIPDDYIKADAAFKLRWIDCAPEGARHQAAPLQDKRGAPMGDCWNENLGPNRAVREARIARGRHPLSGERVGEFVVRDPEAWQAVAAAGFSRRVQEES